ncbi:phytanoyl-CoA dioxygenase family protein [Paenibacillus chitinolyticus]|uniref:phytanoyl-CoA dioxygenase family protein n=1 Tax=Paenibacillus chitinolyticus TaxID=79263 RepID=UPI00386D8855
MKELVTEAHKRSYEENGFAVIRGVFTSGEMAELKRLHHSIWTQRVQEGKIVQDPEKPLVSLFDEMHETYRLNAAIMNYYIDPRNFEIVENLIGEEALAVGSTFYYKSPGSNMLVFHQDNYDIGVTPGTSCAYWVSLDEAAPENGGLMYIPKTHRYGLLQTNLPKTDLCEHLPEIIRSEAGPEAEVPDTFEIVNVHTEPGDVVVHTGDVIHGSWANRSADKFRHAFGIHFVAAGAEKIFMFNNDLMDKYGNNAQLKLNKRHARIRTFNSYEVLKG